MGVSVSLSCSVFPERNITINVTQYILKTYLFNSKKTKQNKNCGLWDCFFILKFYLWGWLPQQCDLSHVTTKYHYPINFFRMSNHLGVDDIAVEQLDLFSSICKTKHKVFLFTEFCKSLVLTDINNNSIRLLIDHLSKLQIDNCIILSNPV